MFRILWGAQRTNLYVVGEQKIPAMLHSICLTQTLEDDNLERLTSLREEEIVAGRRQGDLIPTVKLTDSSQY